MWRYTSWIRGRTLNTLGKFDKRCATWLRLIRRTIGVAPHHWLLTRRIEVAKEKLRDRRLSLSDTEQSRDSRHRGLLARVGGSGSAASLAFLPASSPSSTPARRRSFC
jgi:hypothetical protein